MNLIDENEEFEQEASKKKFIKYIILAIVGLIIIAVLIIVFSTLKKNNTLKLVIDDESKKISDGLVLMKDNKNIYIENDQIYLSAKKLAYLLNITYNNDEYKVKGEDVTKCHIKNGNEYTSFISNSPTIYKTIIYDENQYNMVENNKEIKTESSSNNKNEQPKTYIEHEYFQVENGVKYINDEIYLSLSAISLGFNVSINYDVKTKTINIKTLSKLEAIASQNVSNAVIGDRCDYFNKKLLKYGLVLVQNTEGNYGIVSYSNYEPGSYVLSCNYSKVRYSEGNSILTVVSANKGVQGIFTIDVINEKANVMIEPKYDEIRLIDEKTNLYLVKELGRYGVIKISSDNKIDVILKSEYQKIGIDDNVYTEVDNKYILDGKYIPVKSDTGWGLANINGKIRIIPQYPEIGCNLEEAATGNPAIVLPNLIYNVPGIVFLTNAEKKYYSVLNAETGEKISNFNAKEIYSQFESDKRVYYMKAEGINGNVVKDIDIYGFFGKKESNNTNELINQTNNNKTENNQENNKNENTTQINKNENIVVNEISNQIKNEIQPAA